LGHTVNSAFNGGEYLSLATALS